MPKQAYNNRAVLQHSYLQRRQQLVVCLVLEQTLQHGNITIHRDLNNTSPTTTAVAAAAAVSTQARCLIILLYLSHIHNMSYHKSIAYLLRVLSYIFLLINELCT